MTNLFLNVHWFLCILKPALLPHANTQSPDVIAYLPVDYITSPVSLYTNLAVYNQVKKLTTRECAPALGQEKSRAHRRVGVLQNVFWLSGEHTHNLRFAHSFAKSGFELHFEYFDPVDSEIESVKPCNDAQSLFRVHDFNRSH